MSSWCNTAIAVFGQENDLKRFYSILNELNSNTTLLGNGFGNMWEGNLVYYAGADYHCVECRGEIISYEYSTDGHCVYINQNDAWTPNTEYLRVVFNYLNLDLDFVYIAEEPGCEVFINTDTFGMYFKTKYCLDMESSETGYYQEYYTESEFDIMMNEVRCYLKNPDLKTIHEAKMYAKELDDIEYFNIYVFREE